MQFLRSDDQDRPDLAVDVSGCRTGQTPVVLVHGMGGDHTTWSESVRALRATCRPTISLDLRGHGRSARARSYALDDFADDLRRVADEFSLQRVDLVGHSLGAHAALRFAMSDPDRVGRMVLEEVPPMPRDDADVAEKIAPSATLGERIRGIGALIANPGPYLRFDRALPDQVLGQFDVPAPAWWERLSGVSASTLVVSGGDRSFLPPRHLRALADAMPDSDFHTIDAGHSVHRDRSHDFVAAMLGHLED